MSAINRSAVRRALVKVANSHYDSKCCESIIGQSRVELIFDFLCLLQNQRKCLDSLSILDVGCGKCDLLLLFKDLGAKRLVGVNLFPLNNKIFRSEELVTELFGNEAERIRYIECDVDKNMLPFPDETFDVVFLTDVLEHLHNPDFALKEIARVMKSEGYLCLETPNCANLKNRVRLLFGESPYHDLKGWLFNDRFYVPKTGEKKFQGHIREYCVEELTSIVNYLGFKPLYTKFHQAELYPQHRTLLKIYNLLERLYPHFAYTISMIAIKSLERD